MTQYDFNSRRSVVRCTGGMVATSQPLAALSGLDALRAGGDAVDAAVTTAAMLNVVEPVSTGIGGDMFALVWRADKAKLYALNGSGRAPAAATLETFFAHGLTPTDKIPNTGPLPITVPGALHGWDALLQRWGRRTLADALSPAIRTAHDGYPVTEFIADGWTRNAPRMRRFPDTVKSYLVDGKAPRVGQIMRIPALGRSFERIAAEGIDVFYSGEIGRSIADAVRAEGGVGFSLDPEHPNCVGPGKRPYHTIIPAMITREGKALYSFGVMGGPMQPQGHLQVAVNLIDMGMDPQRALDAPRFRVIEGKKVSLEPGLPAQVVETLRQRGHEIVSPEHPLVYGGGQIIMIDPETGALAGGSDPRKDGCAIGY